MGTRSIIDGVVLQLSVLFGGRVYTGILHELQGEKEWASGVRSRREQQ